MLVGAARCWAGAGRAAAVGLAAGPLLACAPGTRGLRVPPQVGSGPVLFLHASCLAVGKTDGLLLPGCFHW